MNEFFEEAKKKLDEGKKENLDRYGNAMKKDVADALLNFCEQDAEFAQAVAQGGSFKDCMAAVAKGVTGSAISDMESYGAAVRFYFPGAGIDVKMTIDLCASVHEQEKATPVEEAAPAEKPRKSVVVDLSDYF